MINKEKSSVLFSKNTKQEKREGVKSILNINKEGHSGKYLGLPVYIGKSKRKTFASKRENMEVHPRLEGKTTVQGRKRNPYQSSGTSCSSLCYGLL
jgi:hypothetical protein